MPTWSGILEVDLREAIPADFPELQPFVAEPQRSALLFDVDGTLAPIVMDPEAAAVPDSTRDLLGALARRYALVACVSGRRARDARRIVGLDSIAYIGNHGLERLDPGAGEVAADPALEPLARAVRSFARGAYDTELRRLGVLLEDKDAIWAFHWRGATDESAAREALRAVAAQADREGLVPHWGRMVLEIRPPVATDKGTAVARALDGRSLARALYAGDDTTDLDVFRKLRALEAAGQIEAVCVGVRSAEGPEAIEREADLVVDGPAGVVKLLAALDGP
jgi:trehalose 6-phosphate phosphatase